MSLSRRPTLRVVTVVGVLVALVLALGLPGVAAAQSPSPLDPAAPNAALIKRLYDILFWSAAVVFVLVEGLLIYSVVKFGRKSPDEMPVQIHGNTQVEIAWTVAPAFLLLVITFLSWQTMRTTSYIPETADKMVVEVTGRQFLWQFNYPEFGIQTTNEYYVPLGKTIELQMQTPDVNHAYWVPQLGGKTDLIAGRVTKQWFKAEREGTFFGQCAELCGSGHEAMRLEVHVVQPEEFEAWVAEQRGETAGAGGPVNAEELYVAQGCSGCHALSAVGANGAVGPTHDGMGTIATERLADPAYTGEATTAEEYIRESIVNPGVYLVPGYQNIMPAFDKLSEEQLNALVELLAAQK